MSNYIPKGVLTDLICTMYGERISYSCFPFLYYPSLDANSLYILHRFISKKISEALHYWRRTR